MTQRYALDFVIENGHNLTHQGDGKKLRDYFCFESDVISPADGVVVEVSNKIKDYEGVGDYSIDWKARDFRGNFVVIKHSKNEYSFIAHFKHNTIRVKKGEKIMQGQLIGQCGNSGHSTEPHLHFHLQDHKIFWLATGLPIRFKRFSAKSENKDLVIRIDDFAEKDDIVSNTLSE